MQDYPIPFNAQDPTCEFTFFNGRSITPCRNESHKSISNFHSNFINKSQLLFSTMDSIVFNFNQPNNSRINKNKIYSLLNLYLHNEIYSFVSCKTTIHHILLQNHQETEKSSFLPSIQSSSLLLSVHIPIRLRQFLIQRDNRFKIINRDSLLDLHPFVIQAQSKIFLRYI